jgi:hypothetical protein
VPVGCVGQIVVTSFVEVKAHRPVSGLVEDHGTDSVRARRRLGGWIGSVTRNGMAAVDDDVGSYVRSSKRQVLGSLSEARFAGTVTCSLATPDVHCKP